MGCKPRVSIRDRDKSFFLFSETSRPALEPTQTLIQLVLGFFPWVKWRGALLATRVFLVPLGMSGAVHLLSL